MWRGGVEFNGHGERDEGDLTRIQKTTVHTSIDPLSIYIEYAKGEKQAAVLIRVRGVGQDLQS